MHARTEAVLTRPPVDRFHSIVLVLFLVLQAGGCSAPPPGLTRYEFAQRHMGETARLTFFATDDRAAREAAREAFDRIAAIDSALSDYKPDSDAARLCTAPIGQSYNAGDDLFDALQRSRDLHDRTDGAFDVTIGPIVGLWRTARRDHVLPTEAALAAARESCGWEHVDLDTRSQSVTLAHEGMKLDFGGIGKGLAVDAAVQTLRGRGIDCCLVALGGDIVAGNPPPSSSAWRVELQSRSPADREPLVLRLENCAVSTSGDLHQFVEIDGVRHSHIISPFTGAALTTPCAVTVIARDGATADALATALCVVAPKRGLQLLARFPGAEARIETVHDGETDVVHSMGFNTFLDTCPSPPPSRGEGFDDRMQWWRDARFGMFIHWGLYSIPAGEWNGKDVPGVGEWIMYHGRITPADYESLVPQFNPVHFNASEWARIARRAGMKYLVITTKHHDGFALFNSQISDYDIIATPFRRDIMKELANACRNEGIRIGWYHSIMDWHHPDYLPRREWDSRPTHDAEFDRFIAYLHAQVREILTQYGPIDIMWFDGEWEDTWTHAHGVQLFALVRQISPNTIVNNRVDKGRAGMAGLTTSTEFRGDFETPEQEIPATGLPGVDWETCMTMNDTWGFKSADHNWKSSDQLIRHLVDVASKGGNVLLNVGPDALGRIPDASIERLQAVGDWLALNGDAIYGTSAAPLDRLAWGRCTQRSLPNGDTRLYLHVFDAPVDGVLVVPRLSNPLIAAHALAGRSATPLPVSRVPDGVKIQVNDITPTPPVTVIVLDIRGAPHVEPFFIQPDADGSIVLRAVDATVHGNAARYESGHGKDNIGFWTDASDSIAWRFRAQRSGSYRALMTYACDPSTPGGRFSLQLGEQSIEGTVHPTESWTDFHEFDLGELLITSPGKHELRVSPIDIPANALMNLQSIRLRPSE